MCSNFNFYSDKHNFARSLPTIIDIILYKIQILQIFVIVWQSLNMWITTRRGYILALSLRKHVTRFFVSIASRHALWKNALSWFHKRIVAKYFSNNAYSILLMSNNWAMIELRMNNKTLRNRKENSMKFLRERKEVTHSWIINFEAVVFL